MSEKCAAAGRGCGTPRGWRVGGRCWRCRTAHNVDTAKYRGLTDGQRATALAALRAGETTDRAAELAGTTPAKMSARAGRDGELRAAMDGQPLPYQMAARMGDYLLALTRTGGDTALAQQITGNNRWSVQGYRRTDPNFAAAEKAIYHWLDNLSAHPFNLMTSARLDRAAEVLEAGGNLTAAAGEIGAKPEQLRLWASRHARLAAVLPPPKTSGGAPRRNPTEEEEATLRALWPDRKLSKTEIGRRLNTSHRLIARWADDLGLPPRPRTRHRPAGPR